MRIVDLQMSFGGSAPAGAQFGAAQAVQTYRFLRDVDHAKRENLHRQESVVTSSPAAASLRSQDVMSTSVRNYVNRARRDPERGEAEMRRPGRYGHRRSPDDTPGQIIDFLA